MFGKKKTAEATVLLLDVESSSVGGALARFSPKEQPRLFGEMRHAVPMLTTRDSNLMTRHIEEAARSVLLHANTIAARLRNYANTTSAGEVDRVAVFLGAPWGSPDLKLGKPAFIDPMRAFITDEVAASLPGVKISFHTGADPAVFGLKVFNPQSSLLLLTVRGELAELLLLGNGGVEGYATIPLGARTILRTLKTHGGLSEAEANSLFTLSSRLEGYDPLHAAGKHFIEEFSGTAQTLLHNGRADEVFVLAEKPAGEWFAQALARDHSLSALFPEGGSVRALGPRHFAPHVAAHATNPDLFLMLEALFIDSKLSGIY